MKWLANIPVIALLLIAPAVADHSNHADWSWHVLSSGISESRVSIYRLDQPIGIFNFSCDLTDADNETYNGTGMKLVRLDSHPEGLLLVTCNAGAHSQQVAIIDLASKSNQPVLTRTGSYFASWELQQGELWISYDQPCAAGIGAECPNGFETIFDRYPE